MTDQDSAEKHDYPGLLSLAVHELRTPASVVAGYLHMLGVGAEPPLPPRQQKMVEEAEKAFARMSELVEELSELGKLDANTATVHEQSFDLFEVLPAVAAEVHEAEERGVRLQLAGAISGAPMRGDLPRLKAAFHGFFRLVMREQRTSGTVVVDRRRDATGDSAVAVVVIAESSHVDQSYYAARQPLDVRRGGLGLSLPIGVRVVERHDGTVWSPMLKDATAVVATLPLPESR
jgi:signal transduction histidine kinase